MGDGLTPPPGKASEASDVPSADEPDPWYTSLAVPVIIVAIAMGLIVAIVFVAQQEQGEGRTALEGTTVEPETLPVTVPYSSVGGSIVIDVTLGEGSRTVPMILDTGAPTIVSEEIAEVFGSGTAGTTATATADGQVITNDVVSLPQLAIGEAVFRDVGAVVGAIEPGNPFYCISEGGFIGASLMQAAVWQIDPAAGTVTIAESSEGLDHVDGAIRLDFVGASDVSPSPLVELLVRDEPLTFLLDTGSDGWLVVNTDDLNEIGIYAAPDAPAMVVRGASAGGAVSARIEWVSAGLQLDARPQWLPMATSRALPQGQGNAGTDFLRHFVATYDWSEDAVYLDPITDLVPSTPLSAGLAWDDGYVVGAIMEGQPGNEALSLGIEVVAIDGRAVSGAPFDDFCSRLSDGPDSYEMTVAGEVPTTVDVAPVEDFYGPLAQGSRASAQRDLATGVLVGLRLGVVGPQHRPMRQSYADECR